MNNIFKHIISSAIIATTILSSSPMVYASTIEGPQPPRPTAEAGKAVLKKYLVIDNDATVPAETFTFTVGAGGTVSNTDGHMRVYAGKDPDKVTITNPQFTVGQDTTSGTATDGIANSTEKKYAVSDITLDFTGITFTEPGVYRYTLTEDASSGAVNNDSEAVRTIDVYVDSNDNGELSVTNFVSYLGNVTAAPKANATAAGEKSYKYVNTFDTERLTISKTVTGNQGSHDQYFEFTVAVSDAGDGTVIGVSGMDKNPVANDATDFSADDMKTANDVASITADKNGSVTHKFYLQHGDQVVLTGLPKGAKYTVTETKANGYTTSVELTGNDADAAVKTDNHNVVEDSITGITGDTTAAYTNNRQGAVPTGLAMSVIPGIAIIAVAVAGLVISKKKKNA